MHRRYFIAAVLCFCASWTCQMLYARQGATVDQDGMLHEQFGFIPLGWLVGGGLQEVESRLAADDGAAPREYSRAHITHALRARPRPRVSLLAQVLSLLALLVQKYRY